MKISLLTDIFLFYPQKFGFDFSHFMQIVYFLRKIRKMFQNESAKFFSQHAMRANFTSSILKVISFQYIKI